MYAFVSYFVASQSLLIFPTSSLHVLVGMYNATTTMKSSGTASTKITYLSSKQAFEFLKRASKLFGPFILNA